MLVRSVSKAANLNFKRGYSSARLERTPDKGEVVGSSPTSPTNGTIIAFYRQAGRGCGGGRSCDSHLAGIGGGGSPS